MYGLLEGVDKVQHLKETRDLLYNYKSFKCILADKKMLLDEVEKYGLPDRSSSVSIYPTSPTNDSKDDVKEEYINTLQHQIKSLERHISAIDGALNTIKHDKYYRIIEYKYFNRLSCRQIGEIYYLDKSNVSRQDKRLLKELASCLFPNNATFTQPLRNE